MSGTGNIKISFIIDKNPLYIIGKTNEKESFKCVTENNMLYVSVYYDFKECPLKLEAEIKPGDGVRIILMNFRIELWVNGKLCDEEWPYGKILFDGKIVSSSVECHIEDYTYIKELSPEVITEFVNAEGWKPADNVFVGDCMPYVNNERYHVLFLKDRHRHKSKWGLGAHQWEHISTSDFVNWQIHPTAIEITEPVEGSICTGCWIKKEKKEYLFYTVRMADGSAAPIKRSVSDDGFHFEKDGGFELYLPKEYDGQSARDPKVVRDGKGIYHMFVTTSLSAEGKGCLAHLISEDLDSWQCNDNPVYISENEAQPECSDCIMYDGRIYLIFSPDISQNRKTKYMLLDENLKPLLPQKIYTLPTDIVVPKGAVWEGKIIFTGFNKCGKYASTMTFKRAICDKDGKLIFPKQQMC